MLPTSVNVSALSMSKSEEPTSSQQPSETPTEEPTLSQQPSETPTEEPTLSQQPSETPTEEPTSSQQPSETPQTYPGEDQVAAARVAVVRDVVLGRVEELCQDHLPVQQPPDEGAQAQVRDAHHPRVDRLRQGDQGASGEVERKFQ